jgi:hypothetical protein
LSKLRRRKNLNLIGPRKEKKGADEDVWELAFCWVLLEKRERDRWVGCVSVMKVDSEGHLSRSVGENVKQEHLIKVGYFSCLINYAGSGHAYRRLAREREREREKEKEQNGMKTRFRVDSRGKPEKVDSCAPSGLK